MSVCFVLVEPDFIIFFQGKIRIWLLPPSAAVRRIIGSAETPAYPQSPMYLPPVQSTPDSASFYPAEAASEYSFG